MAPNRPGLARTLDRAKGNASLNLDLILSGPDEIVKQKVVFR